MAPTRRLAWPRRPAILALALLVLASCAAPAAPSAPASGPAAAAKPAPASDERALTDFYQGKMMSIIVGAGPGGVYDTWARTVARHLRRYVPGNPNIIVENRQGADGMIAVNHLTNVAPKDGTMLALFPETLIWVALQGARGMEFDFRNLAWIGSLSQVFDACIVASRTGVTSMQDLIGTGRQLTVGGTTPAGRMGYEPLILNQTLGTNFKIVLGYDGAPKVRLGMESGELDGACWNWDSISTTPEWYTGSDPFVRILVTFAEARQVPDEPHFRNVPTAVSLAPNDDARRLMQMAVAPTLMGKPLVMAPDVPAERLAMMRQAFQQVVVDPEFRADVEKAKLLPFLQPADHLQVKEIVDSVFGQPSDVVERFKAILQGSN
jgi:tripartite-type tricarboxylate transporter receptor subunit TctC